MDRYDTLLVAFFGMILGAVFALIIAVMAIEYTKGLTAAQVTVQQQDQILCPPVSVSK